MFLWLRFVLSMHGWQGNGGSFPKGPLPASAIGLKCGWLTDACQKAHWISKPSGDSHRAGRILVNRGRNRMSDAPCVKPLRLNTHGASNQELNSAAPPSTVSVFGNQGDSLFSLFFLENPPIRLSDLPTAGDWFFRGRLVVGSESGGVRGPVSAGHLKAAGRSGWFSVLFDYKRNRTDLVLV